MSHPRIDPGRKRAIEGLRLALLRYPLEGVTLPTPTATVEQALKTLRAGTVALERSLKEAEQSRDELEHGIAAARRRQARSDSDPWKLLERAYNTYEAELLGAKTMKDRVAEGRRSLTPKIEKAIQKEIMPKVEKQGGQIVATLSKKRLDKLADATLPGWRDGWLRYAFDQINLDFTRLRERIWQPHEGELPVPLPPFEDLGGNDRLKEIIGLPELPATVLSKELPKLGSGLYRHGRTLLYGALSLSFAGSRACNSKSEPEAAFVGADSGALTDATQALADAVNQSDPSVLEAAAKQVVVLTQQPEASEITTFFGRLGSWFIDGNLWIWGLIPTALAFGFWQVRSERLKERARLEEDLRNKSERAVKDALKHWLDRGTDHLTEDIRRQLFARRKALREWYRTQVQPEIVRARGASERALERLDGQQREVAMVRQRVSELERLRGELLRLELALQ